jgi:hypothetical protein
MFMPCLFTFYHNFKWHSEWRSQILGGTQQKLLSIYISVYAFVFCGTDSIHSVIGYITDSEEHADYTVS